MCICLEIFDNKLFLIFFLNFEEKIKIKGGWFYEVAQLLLI